MSEEVKDLAVALRAAMASSGLDPAPIGAHERIGDGPEVVVKLDFYLA